MSHTRALKLAGDDSWVKRNCLLSKCVHTRDERTGEKNTLREQTESNSDWLARVSGTIVVASDCATNLPCVYITHAHTHSYIDTRLSTTYHIHIKFHSHSILCLVVFSRADCTVPQAPATDGGNNNKGQHSFAGAAHSAQVA